MKEEPISLGDGVEPGPEHPGAKWYAKEIKIEEPIPMCSVCKEKNVCWLEDTSTGKVLEIFDKCKDCFFGFPKFLTLDN